MNKLKKWLSVLIMALLILTNTPKITVEAVDSVADKQYTEADKAEFKFSYNFYRWASYSLRKGG